jgi:hypothetical protein
MPCSWIKENQVDTKYKQNEADEQPTNAISEQSLKEVQQAIPGFQPSEDIKVLKDNELEDVELVIVSRYTGDNAAIYHGIPYSIGRCCSCNHEVIISNSSPIKPLKLCVLCAIEEGKVPDQWVEKIKARLGI